MKLYQILLITANNSNNTAEISQVKSYRAMKAL